MTEKKKTEMHDGDEWVDVSGQVAGDIAVVRGRSDEAAAVSLALDNSDGVPEPGRVANVAMFAVPSVAEALAFLRRLRVDHAIVDLAAPCGLPLDQAVADGHAFNGQHQNGEWLFDKPSLDMACRVAGWSKVEHLEPGKVRLS